MNQFMTANRGITVGKSWPRPATPINLVPKWEGEFSDFHDWVSFASKWLTVATDSNGMPLSAICVDTLGRRCANGGDFMRARDEDTFPVRYFFECIEGDQCDADLIVTAVNALPELIRRLGLDVDESAWLIEFPADKYGPVRYWAAGEELPVIDVDHATRFARKEDAAAIIRMLNFNTGWQQAVKPAEHLWVKGHK
jgi:hypothetical protein